MLDVANPSVDGFVVFPRTLSVVYISLNSEPENPVGPGRNPAVFHRANIVSTIEHFAKVVGTDPTAFATHSIRRAKVTLAETHRPVGQRGNRR
jgi:hypothetical protein